MRGTTITLALLLLLPIAASAATPLRVPAVVPLRDDGGMSDADLLRAIAAKDGLTLPNVVLPPLAARADTAALLMGLAERSGATLAPADVEPFLALDPRVLAPVTTLLVATTMAWDLRDMAMEDLAAAEQLELLTLARENSPDPARGATLVSQVEREYVFAAAILLLDTAEGIVVPQLQEAVRQGAWPATAVADPVGILRLGGAGNDVETIDRLIQIDPTGNDLYRNNAGATNYGDILQNAHPVYPVSLSIDFEGDDDYIGRGTQGFDFLFMEGQGAAGIGGIGILLDYAGDDEYYCARYCQGAGSRGGIGYFRDLGGNDLLSGRGLAAIGYAEGDGVGIHRNDAGSDVYQTATGGGVVQDVFAVRQGTETGILWDRAGSDIYENFDSVEAFGLALGWGRGWLADEGPELDFYGTASLSGPYRHGCNDCSWVTGSRQSPISSAPGGRGADNFGGLAYLLSQDP